MHDPLDVEENQEMAESQGESEHSAIAQFLYLIRRQITLSFLI